MTKILYKGSKLEDTISSEYSGGSKGAMLGLTRTTMREAPISFFKNTSLTTNCQIFFEDCLMACVFTALALIENNKIGF
jgi:hypothetical protein